MGCGLPLRGEDFFRGEARLRGEEPRGVGDELRGVGDELRGVLRGEESMLGDSFLCSVMAGSQPKT